MEAKVDVRKLQLLNDRINQTIEALNQVRMSVHGLSHTQGVQPNIGTPPVIGYNAPIGQQFQGRTQWPMGFGFQHTAGIPFGQVPQYVLPMGQYLPQYPVSAGMAGLAHTGTPVIQDPLAEMRAADPNRFAQTFPFAWTIV